MLGLLLALTVGIYWPGLSGGFNFDDGPNIVDNAALHAHSWSIDDLWQAALSGDAGPLKRPVAMLSFAMNYLASGLDPFYFKLTNLAIHLINGVLVFWLCALLMRALRECCGAQLDERSGQWVAVLAAGLWLVAPINLTGVLYIVQRMTSLSALFTLLGVGSYVQGRLRMCRGESGGPALIWLGTIVFGALAVLSKENGALLPLFAATCELSFFRLKAATLRDRHWVIGYLLLFVVLPGVAALAYLASMPAWLQHSYTARPFTMGERLLTESRVLFYYLRLILAPSNAALGLFHDDFGLSRSLFQPLTTLFSIAGLIALLVLAWMSRRRYPVLTFAVLWFLAGQVMESTVLSLELIHEHRNYLPCIGPLLAMAYFLFAGATSADLRRALRLAAVGLVLVFSLVTFVRAEEWRDPFSLATMAVLHHPDSARAHYELGRLYFIAYANGNKNKAYLEQAREHFLKAADLDKSRQKPLFALIQLAFLEGRQAAPGLLLRRLDRRISTQPFQSADTADLIVLVKCQQSGRCRLKAPQMLGIFDAALRNPTVGRDARSIILSWKASYYANVMHDYHRAEAIFRRVVQLEPQRTVYRTNLIQVLVINGEIEQARAQLRAAQRADTLDAHRGLIDRYRRVIDEAARKAKRAVPRRAGVAP